MASQTFSTGAFTRCLTITLSCIACWFLIVKHFFITLKLDKFHQQHNKHDKYLFGKSEKPSLPCRILSHHSHLHKNRLHPESQVHRCAAHNPAEFREG